MTQCTLFSSPQCLRTARANNTTSNVRLAKEYRRSLVFFTAISRVDCIQPAAPTPSAQMGLAVGYLAVSWIFQTHPSLFQLLNRPLSYLIKAARAAG